MSKPIYIYSTLSCDQHYRGYTQGATDMPQIEHTVHINGGANVADKRFVTPRGVVTPVSEQELALLEQNHVFQLHRKNGFISVDTSRVDPDARAAAMEGRDQSAPLVEQDFANEDVTVKSNGEEASVKRGPGRPRNKE